MEATDIVITILIFLLLIGFVSGLAFAFINANQLEPVERTEQPHLYWKTIDVKVISVNQKHWYASTHHYVLEVTVYSAEYDLTTTLTENGSGAFTPPHWNIQEGDTVKATLYSWKMDSTEEIIRREIHAFA